MKIFISFIRTLVLFESFIFHSCKTFKTQFNNKLGFHCYFAEDQCPHKDIQFYLYTRETVNNPILLDPLKLTADLFPQRLPLKILVHGLGLNHNLSPNQELRPLLLQLGNTYIVSVDYAALSRVVCYFPWAVYNARVVGKCLATLLNTLMDQGIYSPEDLHIIGFSLGAQIAGLAANYLKSKIARITALDPAGNVFDNFDPTDRLDASDAEFVDAIHTTTRFFSSRMAVGHADFYPNFLDAAQPGCNILTDINLCSHFRSNMYYAESIVTNVGFWSYNCGNYTEFLFNQCAKYADKPQVEMGYFLDKRTGGSYFLETNAESPYAQGPFAQIELEVADYIDSK